LENLPGLGRNHHLNLPSAGPWTIPP
jgi:hypothetical protein